MKKKREREQIVIGYKLNSYNAMYEKTTFGVSRRYADSEKCVLEICDINSGITFYIDLKDIESGEVKNEQFVEKDSEEYARKELQRLVERIEDNSRDSGKQRFTKRNGSKFIAYYGASGNRERSDDAERND